MGLLDGLLGQMMGGANNAGSAGNQDPMGGLGGILGGLTGQGGGMPGMGAGPAQGGNPLLMILLQLLQQNGGLGGLMGRMQQSGMGDQVQSWIGTGQNQSISPDALSQIFGQGQLGQIAQQLGMSQQEAAGGMAQMLPDLVNEMTPQGQIPQNDNDLVSQVLASLQQSDALQALAATGRRLRAAAALRGAPMRPSPAARAGRPRASRRSRAGRARSCRPRSLRGC